MSKPDNSPKIFTNEKFNLTQPDKKNQPYFFLNCTIKFNKIPRNKPSPNKFAISNATNTQLQTPDLSYDIKLLKTIVQLPPKLITR